MGFGCVVLAGSPNKGPLLEASPEEWEALIDINGRPMISYVLDALRGSERVTEIVIVGPRPLNAEAERVGARLVESSDSLVENLALGVKALSADRSLIVTSDIPLIAGAMVDEFLDRCSERQGDFFYSVIPRPAVEARYPGTKRTYIRLKEGQLTGGNMVVLKSEILERFRAVAERIVSNRKRPWALAREMGFGFLLLLLLGKLDIPRLEQRISKIFGVKAHAVLCWDPEIGIDVDKPSDLELSRRALQS